MKTGHDADCEIYSAEICTCGYFHRVARRSSYGERFVREQKDYISHWLTIGKLRDARLQRDAEKKGAVPA